MDGFPIARRSLLVGAGAASMALAANAQTAAPKPEYGSAGAPTADQQRRMAWWHAARFGMFVHFGLYSGHQRHEWAMEDEAIPVAEYQKFTTLFHPEPGWARTLARLAKKAGMKYMVLTSKHHEGFCNWDTKLTNYNAAQAGTAARHPARICGSGAGRRTEASASIIR